MEIVVEGEAETVAVGEEMVRLELISLIEIVVRIGLRGCLMRSDGDESSGDIVAEFGARDKRGEPILSERRQISLMSFARLMLRLTA